MLPTRVLVQERRIDRFRHIVCNQNPHTTPQSTVRNPERRARMMGSNWLIEIHPRMPPQDERTPI